MTGDWLGMLDPRHEFSTSFSTPEDSRYAAECRRLAAMARPMTKAVARKRAASRLQNIDWSGWMATQFRAPPRRQRKFAATWAHR